MSAIDERTAEDLRSLDEAVNNMECPAVPLHPGGSGPRRFTLIVVGPASAGRILLRCTLCRVEIAVSPRWLHKVLDGVRQGARQALWKGDTSGHAGF